MTELKLYNTLTRKKEIFTPLDPSNVRMYVCGPTVYDFAHIGNARPVIVFDVLFRLLRHLYGADHVTYARNITDVDDKINARAVRDFPDLPLNEAIRKVTEATAAQFHADVAALGCLEPTHEPRATEHIGKMIDIIGRLLANGYAYIAQGTEGREVLFSVEKMKRYGQLSNRKLEEQREGARVAVEPHKKNAGDFVLWKESSANEPGWAAEFQPDSGYRPKTDKVTIYGRPGWHIECSAMSMAKLLEPYGGGLTCDDPVKNTFDIHGGGLDLIFPHHENEIAQSCCAFGKPGQPNPLMAQVWMHNGYLQVEGQKMSKSLGNFRTIRKVLNDWPGVTVRLNMLRTHYRQPIDWTDAALEECENKLCEISYILKKYRDRHTDWCENCAPSDDLLAVLSDDLNTPESYALLNSHLEKAEKSASHAQKLYGDAHFLGVIDLEYIDYYCQFLVRDANGDVVEGDNGLSPMHPAAKRLRSAILNNDQEAKTVSYAAIRELGYEFMQHNLDDGPAFSLMPIEGAYRGDIQLKITARLAARNAKNFAESDRIRDELVAMGIQIMDSKDPVTGELKTTWEVKR